jgi:hypothetical protein
MKIWSRIAGWGLAGLITLNIAGTAYYFVLQQQIRQVQPKPSMVVGDHFPPLSGTDVQGVKWWAGNAPCRVVRIADDRCPYCEKDKPSYEKLVDAAQRTSCEVIEIAPQAGGMAYDPRPGVVQLKYVDADVGSALYPFATPQTIILDRDWSVRMTRRGMFDEQSLASTLALLETFSSLPAAL